MGKEKTKSKKKNEERGDVICRIDNSMNLRFQEMQMEIEFYQREIDKAEAKARKKAKKKMKKKNDFYVPNAEENIRKMVIRQMEGSNFFERVINLLKELVPFARVIAELVKSLIVAILSVDSIKYRIKPTTLQSINNVYGIASSVVNMA